MVTVVDTFLNTSARYIMNATNAVVEGKLEPMSAAPMTQQLVVTGQYLYDNFVKVSEEQITRMTMIRTLIGKADALAMKGAADKMVELAVSLDYPEGKPKKAERRSKEQSAMNARTIILQAWGALTFAGEELKAIGYTETTGYQDMRTLAKKALDQAGLKWDGAKQLSDVEKEQERLKREAKSQMAVLQEVQKENPFDSRVETLQQWNARTFEIAQAGMEQAQAEKTAKAVQSVLDSLTEKYDQDTLFKLAEGLLAYIGCNVDPVPTTTVVVEEPEVETV
jgi:hypothetical protein